MKNRKINHKKNKMKRYVVRKNNVEVDLLWKAHTLDKLHSVGMSHKFMSYRKLMDLLGWSNKNRRRVELLKKGDWLNTKRVRQDKKKRIIFKGQKLLYTFSGKSIKYLKDNYNSFLNPSGSLMRKAKKKVEIKYIEKIKEVPVKSGYRDIYRGEV